MFRAQIIPGIATLITMAIVIAGFPRTYLLRQGLSELLAGIIILASAIAAGAVVRGLVLKMFNE